jgi:hypothetical protein
MAEVPPEPERHLPHFPHFPHLQGNWKIALLFGFLGGVIPTCLKLASAFAGQLQDIDMPKFTFWIAVVFYGMVGATVATAFRQYTSREAFIAGIIAPSLVANLVAGYGEGVAKRPIKTTESFWQYVSPVSRARADDLLRQDPNETIPIDVTGDESTKKVDFEWDVPKDINMSKVKVTLSKSNGSAEKTIYVSPAFSGAMRIPSTYNYVSVENGRPIRLQDGTSQLVIHGDARTSKTNDFLWGLGAPRWYKILNARAEVLPPSK